MEVDGSVVLIEPMEREVSYRYSDGSVGAYRQRSLYKVLVDDVLRGYLSFPMGYGGRWSVVTLRPKHRYSNVWRHLYSDRTEHGLFEYYRSVSPGVLNETENWGEHAKFWEDRNAILAAFPKMIALGRAPSPEEEEANLIQMKADYEESVRQDAANKERWARERAEREAQQAEAARIAEEKRLETLEGLNSILARETLTNFERDCLMTAIARFSN
ncbi:hypothetical protein CcrColossus_gp271 [Caulobacter phage CcrColossus]|uniref:Uncharacterized protein n=1 Tax=Caulobacter phage CcrColossus TaxID=1211640 RepID=K4JSN9_9CAUD|nr:hypothetical protein CcrColossus_gp271 [Caulobacter phage CcrColossus]AFU88141.1 hypothetical protein CcrColossus_gp271 [Caulobacter phage CcrColossus]